MKKGIFRILMANIFGLCMSLFTGFLVPKFLSVHSYAMYKTFALYVSYAGFFSLGYNDGMYLKYGGKEISKLERIKFANDYFCYLLLLLAVMVVVLIFGIVFSNIIVISFAIGMLFTDILGYLKCLHQATGEFKIYSRLLNLERISIFIMTMVLLLVVKTDNYYLYIWCQIIVWSCLSIAFTLSLENRLHFIKRIRLDFSVYKENISSGLVLMLGNFSVILFTGMDLWFIKFFLTTTSFAVYSFAVSLEHFLNVFISPITVSMYNYFCKKPAREKILEIKRHVLLCSFVLIGAAFPVKWILERYLTKYLDSCSVIFVLFLANLFLIAVQGIHVNLYKAERKQAVYLKQMIFMLIVGVVLNAIALCIYKSIVSVAIATLITTAIWLLVCEMTNKKIRFELKDVISIVVISILYLLSGYLFGSILGGIVYGAFVVLIAVIFMRSSFLYFINSAKNFVGKFFR